MLTFLAITFARLLDPVGIGLCALAAWWMPRYWQSIAAGAAAYVVLMFVLGNPAKPIVAVATASAGGLIGFAANLLRAWLATRRVSRQ